MEDLKEEIVAEKKRIEEELAEEQKRIKRAEYAKQYYWDNHDKILEQQRGRYKGKAEKERTRYRKYYRAHRADILAKRKNTYIKKTDDLGRKYGIQ